MSLVDARNYINSINFYEIEEEFTKRFGPNRLHYHHGAMYIDVDERIGSSVLFDIDLTSRAQQIDPSFCVSLARHPLRYVYVEVCSGTCVMGRMISEATYPTEKVLIRATYQIAHHLLSWREVYIRNGGI